MINLGVTVLSEPSLKLTQQLHFVNSPPASRALLIFWLSHLIQVHFFRSAVAQAFLSYLSYLYPVVTANQSQFTSSVTGFLCFKDTVDLNSTISVQTLLWVNMCSRNWLNSMTSKQESRWGENTRPKHYHPNKSNDITSLKTSFSTDMDDTE